MRAKLGTGKDEQRGKDFLTELDLPERLKGFRFLVEYLSLPSSIHASSFRLIYHSIPDF